MNNPWDNDPIVGNVSDQHGTGNAVEDFKNKYSEAASLAGSQLGVDPGVILAQWAQETGYGKHIIPGTNNLGNIKGPGVSAKDNMLGTKDSYATYKDHNDFADNYADLMVRKYPGVIGSGSDAQKFTAALKGYAQDPGYAGKVQKIASAIGLVGGKNPWDDDPIVGNVKDKQQVQIKDQIKAPSTDAGGSVPGFISGNLNKGIAGAIGTPVDLATMGYNKLADVSNKVGGVLSGELPSYFSRNAKEVPRAPENSFGGSKYLEEKLRQANMLNDSSKPTSSIGSLGAGALQMIPNIAAPVAAGYRQIPALLRGAGETLGKIPEYIGGVGKSALDIPAPAAREAAIKGIRGNLDQGIAANTPPKISEPLSHEDIGAKIRSEYDTAMGAAQEYKKAVGNKLYNDMYKEASEYAAITGKRMYTPEGKPISLEDNIQRMKDAQDIANSGKFGDFSAKQKRDALDTASAIRRDITEYTKGFDTPYSKVASEFGDAAMRGDIAGTSLGKKFGTEGGLDRAAYEKIADEKLGAEVFRNSSRMREFEDLLAGGKNATPEARAIAKEKVTDLLEQHLKASLAESTPEQIAKHVAAPRNEAMYNYAPRVATSIESYGKQKLANEFRDELNIYNKTFPDNKDSEEAFKEGIKLMRSANNRGLVTNDQYLMMKNMVDRASTEAERTKNVRKVLAILGLSIGGGEAIRRAF